MGLSVNNLITTGVCDAVVSYRLLPKATIFDLCVFLPLSFFGHCVGGSSKKFFACRSLSVFFSQFCHQGTSLNIFCRQIIVSVLPLGIQAALPKMWENDDHDCFGDF